ncbi:MAG: hypothetical protein ACJ76H_10760 [Bacteriovoracaceae bacterium]
MQLRILLVTLSLLVATEAFAKRFASKYCEFELPPQWECALEGSEYVCQSENNDRKKEAIIILAAKIRGEQDSIDEYMAYLKKQKEYNLPGGKKQISEPKNVTLHPIGDQQWVDALHLASEVPGFYTRYLATVKEDLGVAVTFSVTKDLYQSYLPIIEKLVSTLRVFRQKKTELANMRNNQSGEPTVSDDFIPSAAQDLQANRTQKRGDGEGGDDDMIYVIAVVVVGAVIAIIMKGRKKKGSKPKKKQ